MLDKIGNLLSKVWVRIVLFTFGMGWLVADLFFDFPQHLGHWRHLIPLLFSALVCASVFSQSRSQRAVD